MNNDEFNQRAGTVAMQLRFTRNCMLDAAPTRYERKRLRAIRTVDIYDMACDMVISDAAPATLREAKPFISRMADKISEVAS